MERESECEEEGRYIGRPQIEREDSTHSNAIPSHAHKQILEWDGYQELDKHVQGLVQGCVAIETEDSKIDVVPAECGLEHVETHSHALQPTMVKGCGHNI